MNEIDLINHELNRMKDLFMRVVKIIPKFDILDDKILPYGLKAHTRSVSWLVEQVVVQQAKFNAQKLGITDLDFNLPDTSLHDCIVYGNDSEKFYVNVKITSAGKKQNKNDISAVEKLFMQYKSNPSYRLVFVVFGFEFNNTTITFSKDKVHTFSPQFLPIYVNPRNDKIQALYYSEKEERSRNVFLRLLQEKSKSIVLK